MKIPEGYHANRLSPDAGNQREVAFAEQWKREHENNDLLGWLVEHQPPSRRLRIISKNDRAVASTVVQWLGSNVGMSFLRMALGRCGYEIVETDSAKNERRKLLRGDSR